MRTKCGVKYDGGAEKPANARYGLWYSGDVKFFVTKEEAEKALQGLPPAEREDATLAELEN